MTDKEFMKDQIWTDKPRNFFGKALNFTRYILTPDKLITRTGFLRQREDKILLYRVVDEQTLLPLSQRIFGCGTIVLHARDMDTPTKEIKAIKNPREVAELIEDLIFSAREKYMVPGREMVGAVGYMSDGCSDC